jgi:glycerol-3-phosphate acyltransferase PlsY
LWLKFKGGKGVATYVGVILLINPILFLVFIFSWLLTAKVLKVSSVSALVAYFIVTTTSFFIYDQNIFLLNFFFLIFSIYTHRENIKRLMQKIEK